LIDGYSRYVLSWKISNTQAVLTGSRLRKMNVGNSFYPASLRSAPEVLRAVPFGGDKLPARRRTRLAKERSDWAPKAPLEAS